MTVFEGGWTIPDSVEWTETGGEVLVLDLEAGRYFGLNEIGSQTWLGLAQGAALSEILDDLTDLYEVDRQTLRADLEQLVTSLAANGLLVVEAPE